MKTLEEIENDKNLEEILSKIKVTVSNKTPQEAYKESLKGINIKENEDIILASNNAAYCYYFARDVKGANIEASQEVVIKSNDAFYCYYFAKDIKGANIESLQEVVIKNNNAFYCYLFAKHVKGANIEKLIEIVKLDPNCQEEVKKLEERLKSMQPKKTAKEAYIEALNGINIKENANLFLDNKLNDVFYQYIFSLKVKLDKESRALLIKDLCSKLNCSSEDIVNKLYDLLGYCDDNEILYGFALAFSLKANPSINDIFIQKNIQKAILDSDKCKYVYSFARDIPGVDYEAFIKKLESKPKFIDKANKLRKLAYKRTGNKMFLTNGKVAKNPSKSATDAYKEALMGINVKENQQIVIDDNSDYLICSFAKDVKGADIKLLQNVIIENEDFYFFIKFVNDVKGCDISKFEDFLIKSKNNDAIYTFAFNTPKANIKRLGQAIIESNNEYDNYVFAKNVSGADIKAHIEVLKKHNCLDKVKELEDKLNSEKPTKTNKNLFEETIPLELLAFNKSKNSWLKQNAQEGMYQGIAASAINNLAASLIKLLESLNIDEVSIKIFKDFIETDLGKASLSALIGAGIHFAPNDKIKNNIHIQKVADKCIQNASSKGIEHGFNLAMNFILPALLNAVNTPQAKNLELLSGKLRVNPIDDQIEDEIFEPANEVGYLRK